MVRYRAEVKGIQRWILGSGRMKDIIGGSAIIEDLGRMARERGSGTVRQCAAGAVEFDFEDHTQLEAFARWWPVAVVSHAPGLQVVQAWANEGDVQTLHARLGEARNRLDPELPEAGPNTKRTGRTGLPAVSGGPFGTMDAGTERRHARAATVKDQRFASEDAHFTEGYVAVVHLDGNGIGDLLHRHARSLDVQAFSERLARETRRAFESGLEGVRETGGRLELRPIVIGGDDLTVLTAASTAMGFVRRTLTAFEQFTAGIVGPGSGLTACAGVAIVKRGWPFSDAHDLAERLCKAAKVGLDRRSGFAFRRVTTALAEEDTSEGSRVGAPSPTGPRRLTMNPYPLSQALPLAELSAAVGAVRGPLRGWAELVRTDPIAADDAWDRTREVVTGRPRGREVLDRLDRALAELGATHRGFTRGAAATPLLDALELRAVAAGGPP